MNKSIILTLLINVCGFHLMAQTDFSIKGAVVDSAANIKLTDATLAVLHAKDSMLYQFTRVDENGRFAMADMAAGDYILLVTFPDYADYVQHFSLSDAESVIDFGNLDLILKATLLEEVLITRSQAITIKGDTTEYDAASFVIQPNAKVEDLLKQLPGIQVDQDGKITAQGKTVNKVLVDGEEFFGDDPTLVTKNLRGDMVDKVQLFEKKSDQAEFTGIDDGERTQTLNIKLKEDKKQGYFGKVDAGVGTNDMYQGQAMFNRFKNKQKFSAYGTLGNTGRTGLSWQDSDRFGSSNSITEFTDDGVVMIYGGGGDDIESYDGRYDGRGIPLAHTGGAHFSDKWDDDDQSINANYKLGRLNVTGENNTINQNNLPTGLINTVSDQQFDNRILRHKLGGIYDHRFDSTSTLKVTVDGTLRDGATNQYNLGSSTDGSGGLLNESIRNLNNETNSQVFDFRMLWTKKLRKKGRTLSWVLSEAFNQSRSTGFLFSENTFYSQGVIDSVDLVDQYKTNTSNSSILRSNITYTEPFSAAFSLVLNYGLTLNNGTSHMQSFNALAPGQYDQLDSLFSNDFKLDQLSNQLGAIFNYRKNKHVLNFGTRVSDVRFNQVDRYTGIGLDRHFINYNPQASWQYRFSQQKSFRIGYRGNNTQPSITQIQPVRVNTDPLNIVLGNPDLKPSFTNNFNMSYNSFKVLGNQYMYFYGNFSMTNNPIVSNTFTDSVGRSTFLYNNLEDQRTSNYYAGGNFHKTLKKWNLNVGANLNVSGNTYFNLTNEALNKTVSNSYSGALNIGKNVQKKYDFRLNFGPSYTTSESSLQRQFNNNGWGMNGDFNLNVYLPAKFEIGTVGRYTWNAATESFNEDFERFIVDAAVHKKFLKTDNLKLSLSVNDIFNQNVGFNRSAYNNMISQSNYTTIRRFFMLSLTWDFNKMGGGIKQ